MWYFIKCLFWKSIYYIDRLAMINSISYIFHITYSKNSSKFVKHDLSAIKPCRLSLIREYATRWLTICSGRITVAHLKDLAAPAKHLFWDGSRGPAKGPLEIARWSSINPSLQHVILSTHAGVVVFCQMISSDNQTCNHFLMILCAGLQLCIC